MYRLAIAKTVLEELRDAQQYPAKVFRQLALSILALSTEPRPHDSKAIEGGYRVDSGEYRIYYEVDDRERVVVVLLVGKRNDDELYKRLKRRLGR